MICGPDPAKYRRRVLPFNDHPTLNDNIIAYWPLEETSGTRYDSVAGMQLQELGGTVNSGTGKVNNCMVVSSGVLAKTDCYVLTPSGDRTWTFWYKYGGGDPCTLSTYIINIAGGTPYSFSIGPVNCSAVMTVYLKGVAVDPSSGSNESVNADTAAMSANTWYFVVAQVNHDSKYCRISLNGGAWSTSSVLTSDILVTTSLLLVGDGNLSVAQSIDELGCWGRLLTDGEIAYLYNSGNGRTY
jgi:hypothetical protein